MSRFLDQIRKARQARQEKQAGKEPAGPSPLDPAEEQYLVPEKPTSDRAQAHEATEDDAEAQPKADAPLFPPENKRDADDPAEAMPEEAPTPTAGQRLLPEELEELMGRDDTENPPPTPEEASATQELVPEAQETPELEEDRLPEPPELDTLYTQDEREEDDDEGDDNDDSRPSVSFSELFPEDALAQQPTQEEPPDAEATIPEPQQAAPPEPWTAPGAGSRPKRAGRLEAPRFAQSDYRDDDSDEPQEIPAPRRQRPSTLPELELAEGAPRGAEPSTATRRRKRHRLTRDRTGGTNRVSLTGPDVNAEYVRRVSKVAPRPHKQVVSFYDPKHHVCEEYRLLGKNLLHTFANLPSPGGATPDPNLGRIVALTSSVRGEGKTLTCINLAMTLAQDYCDRVLLIDGDLRHPKVHRYMGLPNSTGLNELVAAPDPGGVLEDSVVRTDSGLHLLPSSATSGNPAPMIDSAAMTNVLQMLRTRYALIVIDTPPVLLATDALTFGVKSDGMLFLLRARKTQREQIQEARQRLARLDIRLLGYVMNNVKSFLPRIWSRYYYGNY